MKRHTKKTSKQPPKPTLRLKPAADPPPVSGCCTPASNTIVARRDALVALHWAYPTSGGSCELMPGQFVEAVPDLSDQNGMDSTNASNYGASQAGAQA